MTKPTALCIALPVPLRKLFSYLPPPECDTTQLKPGIRIRVPFQKKETIGILINTTEEPEISFEKLKPAIELLDEQPLFSDEIWQLCHFAADYYHYPLGEVLSHALPLLLRQGKAPKLSKKKFPVAEVEKNQAVLLNDEQQAALDAIYKSDKFNVYLLDGITGSGKTEVYLQAIAGVLKKEKQVLVLVPEIGLTPQTIQRFRERFSEMVVALHSGLTERERLNAWLLAKSGDAKIVIGTRSAIFTSFKNLGLIVVDEEHDVSFKQQDTFRYHARDLAIMRARAHDAAIILGSATPSLETLHNAKQKRFHHLQLTKRAGDAMLPQFHVLDICKSKMEEGLSQALILEMKEHLAAGNQVMLFLNRRGFSPVLMCHSCGWSALCKRCDRRMTYHQFPKKLHCHHCDTQKVVKNTCENCHSKELLQIGLGTERLEECLKKHFPSHSIVRIDRDSTRTKGSLQDMLNKIQNREHHILIGTQMLAKGHHFPDVTLVAIVDADGGFFSSDFRAIERMGQLILQVAGRAGRVEKQGKVFIQTHHPDHPLLRQLLHENYHEFAVSLLKERESACFPPFFSFALFRAEAYDPQHSNLFLQQIKTLSSQFGDIQVLGPIPAPMPRRAGRHRAQLLVQTARRPLLQQFLKHIVPQIETISGKQRVRWSLDVDPVDMS